MKPFTAGMALNHVIFVSIVGLPTGAINCDSKCSGYSLAVCSRESLSQGKA